MFAKANRLTKRQFDAVFKTGRRTHFPHATIITAPADRLHVSVVVGKKVAKRAVTRNTLRRRIYAAARAVLLPAKSTGVFIILVKPPYATLARKQANETIKDAIATVQKKT